MHQNAVTLGDLAIIYDQNADATLDDLREAVTTLEDTERIARRVLGSAHPIAVGIERRTLRAGASRAPRPRDAVRPLRLVDLSHTKINYPKPPHDEFAGHRLWRLAPVPWKSNLTDSFSENT